MFAFASRTFMLVFCLAAMPLLVGSSCAFFFSSGGGSSDNDNRNDNSFVVVSSGNFGDPPIAGVNYESGALSGVTGENGEFQYEEGKRVQFTLGDIELGPGLDPQAELSTADLVAQDTQSEAREINILRLLMSLDVSPESETITIPPEVLAAAVDSNEAVAAAIEYLDFADNDAFVNAASQLVAVLTADYPFTATLVEADAVSRQPLKSIDRAAR